MTFLQIEHRLYSTTTGRALFKIRHVDVESVLALSFWNGESTALILWIRHLAGYVYLQSHVWSFVLDQKHPCIHSKQEVCTATDRQVSDAEGEALLNQWANLVQFTWHPSHCIHILPTFQFHTDFRSHDCPGRISECLQYMLHCAASRVQHHIIIVWTCRFQSTCSERSSLWIIQSKTSWNGEVPSSLWVPFGKLTGRLGNDDTTPKYMLDYWWACPDEYINSLPEPSPPFSFLYLSRLTCFFVYEVSSSCICNHDVWTWISRPFMSCRSNNLLENQWYGVFSSKWLCLRIVSVSSPLL